MAAKIETLVKRIEGRQKEISKLEKKLIRINKAKESNWENNPYFYDEYDLDRTARELEEVRKALANYESELEREKEKDESRNVEAILEFLNMWAERVMEFYEYQYRMYTEAKEEYIKKEDAYFDWYHHGGLNDPDLKQKRDEFHEYSKDFKAHWSFLMQYVDYKGFRRDKLESDIEQEKKEKYDDIINRANAICGKITDAAGLSVGQKGELNGIVVGERGKARIETIGAGGWNIQCFHFRTLIHEIK